MQLAINDKFPTKHFFIQALEIWFVIDGAYDTNIYCNDDLHLGVVWIGFSIQQFARIQVGHVKAKFKIVQHNFNLEWN
jgi:hypothetical protein